MTTTTAVMCIVAGVLLLGWARSAWISGERTRERDEARTDRDTYAGDLADLHNAQADTQRLPRWQEFLNAQPDPPADDVHAGLAALEDYANGEGR